MWEACSGNLECWEPSQHLLIDTGKPRKTCVEVAGRRTFRILTSSQQSGIFWERHSKISGWKLRNNDPQIQVQLRALRFGAQVKGSLTKAVNGSNQRYSAADCRLAAVSHWALLVLTTDLAACRARRENWDSKRKKIRMSAPWATTR